MRKKLILLILITFCLEAYAQHKDDPDRKQILNKVQQFFDALELQDTVLFKSILLMEGETWAISEKDGSVKYSMRTFQDRLKTFVNPANVIQERMLGAEIKIHKLIAMAWVPYTLDISGKFSHCGIDVFTFLKTREGWKIATAAFTVEPDGCEALKKEIPQN